MIGICPKCGNYEWNKQIAENRNFLALVCNSKDLEKRMREGRHITDTNWIHSSIDYNRWLIENGTLPNQKIDTYDITGKSVSDVADYVTQWVEARL